jgi:hypothetical protein
MKQCVAFIALLTGVLGWGETARSYDVVGVGIWSCAAWTDARKNRNSDTTEQWTLGFLSGIGSVGQHGESLRGLVPREVSEWLDRYCQSNPKDTIVHAAETFSAERQVVSVPSATESFVAPPDGH